MTFPKTPLHPAPRWAGWAALAALAAAAALSGCANTAGGMQVKEIGSLHVGGRAAELAGLPEREIVFSAGSPPLKVNPNGQFEIEQMYVQYVKLASPKARYPLLMMHGGGLTGVTWETKPDGQPGWQQYFLSAGHDLFVSDAVERGRASWARSPEFFKGEAMFRTKKEAWELFRFGPESSWQTDASQRKANDGIQFPIASFDQFMKQGVPRWLTTDGAIQAAYNEFADKHCPCVIITHSQGGAFAFNMALAHPEKIKAVVALEPSGFPDPAKVNLASQKGIPYLFVWGDFIPGHSMWNRIKAGPERYRAALAAQGVKAEAFDLPAMGIKGNSHMLMMDRNSDAVAALVQKWLAEQGLMKP